MTIPPTTPAQSRTQIAEKILDDYARLSNGERVSFEGDLLNLIEIALQSVAAASRSQEREACIKVLNVLLDKALDQPVEKRMVDNAVAVINSCINALRYPTGHS